jgi:hypothetical protein
MFYSDTFPQIIQSLWLSKGKMPSGFAIGHPGQRRVPLLVFHKNALRFISIHFQPPSPYQQTKSSTFFSASWFSRLCPTDIWYSTAKQQWRKSDPSGEEIIGKMSPFGVHHSFH